MNRLATLAKHTLLWSVFFLIGFIGGMWFHDRYGSPKTVQAVTIQKQKVKGEGNAYHSSLILDQTTNGVPQEEQKKNNIIRRIFRRRKNESDSVADRTGETE